MSNQILIDGIDFTGFVEGIDNLSVTYQKDVDTNTTGVRISNELVFRNDAFRYLETKFFSSTSGGDKDAEVKLIVECCGHEYDFFIRGDAVDYCPAICEITGSLTERNAALSTLSDIPEIPDNIFATVPFCVDVSAITFVLFIIFRIFETVIDIIDAILGVVGGGLGALPQQLDELRQFIIGCNRDKGGVNIKGYLEHCANEAGLTLSATTTLDLVGEEYFKTYYVDTNNSLNQLSCIDFLELVKQPFNADYLIQGGTLYFERVDFFSNIFTRFVDVEQIYEDGRSEAPACYRYTPESKPAYGRFEYSRDNIDDRANDILNLTNDIVEFNNPFDPYKRGALTVTIPFSPARYTNDLASNAQIDALRPPNQLIMSTNQSQFPKLVIGDVIGSKLTPQNRPRGGTAREDFTYQMWFDAELDETELYQNFWCIADPRKSQFLPYVLDDFTFQATCEEMTTVFQRGIDLIIETRLGDARAESITINYSQGTITLSGVQII